MPASTKQMSLAERYAYLRKQIKKNNNDGKKTKIISSKVHDNHGLDGSYYLNH